MGGVNTRFTGKTLVSKRYKGVEGPTRPHEARHEKEVRVKQGREIKQPVDGTCRT